MKDVDRVRAEYEEKLKVLTARINLLEEIIWNDGKFGHPLQPPEDVAREINEKLENLRGQSAEPKSLTEEAIRILRDPGDVSTPPMVAADGTSAGTPRPWDVREIQYAPDPLMPPKRSHSKKKA